MANQEGAQHPALSEMQFGAPEVTPTTPARDSYLRKPAWAPRTTAAAAPFLNKWDGTVPAGFYRDPVVGENGGIAAGQERWHEERKMPRPRTALSRRIGLN